MTDRLYAIIAPDDPAVTLTIAIAAALAVLAILFILWAARATRNVCHRLDMIDAHTKELNELRNEMKKGGWS